jgi:hypothetical protein
MVVVVVVGLDPEDDARRLVLPGDECRLACGYVANF